MLKKVFLFIVSTFALGAFADTNIAACGKMVLESQPHPGGSETILKVSATSVDGDTLAQPVVYYLVPAMATAEELADILALKDGEKVCVVGTVDQNKSIYAKKIYRLAN